MSSFVRFVVLVLVIGILFNLALVIFRNERVREVQVKDLEQERGLLAKQIKSLNEQLRHGEMAVEWQKVDANKKVIETSLLLRQFMLTPAGTQEPLPTVRVVIPGKRVCIEGVRLEFADDYMDDYREMRNARLALFTSVYAEDTPENDRFTFLPPYEVPQAAQVHALGADPHVTYFELKLWQAVWDSIISPEEAAKNHVTVLTARQIPSLKASTDVNNGEFFDLTVGLEGVTIFKSDNRTDWEKMLKEAKKLLDKPPAQ